RSAFAALAAAALSVSVVAVAPTTSGAATKASSSSGGTATMALDENLAGFNINTSAAAEFVLQEIMNMVWPQAFIVNNKLQPVLNSQLLESAAQTSTSPQTIVYTLNPKAVWSDGTPITADDFIYNWQAQSGNPAYTDVGGKPYDDASTAGYSQIQSVVGSDPANGAACSPGSTADRNAGLCPNGDTVTVTFKPAFADWRSLFGDIVPAHIARTVGWNTGFSGPTQTISGSWFEIQSYNPNQSVVLVRNPKYWGTPAKLDKLVFQFFSDDSQLVPALQNKEINIFNPSTVNLSIVQTANQVPNSTKATRPGLEFEHFDFNQADPYLAKLQVREAIAHGVNRQAIITRTVGEIAKGINPLGSRVLMPTQSGYQNTSYAYNPSESISLLKELGFKKASDGYFQPNYGPQKGQDLTFTIQSTTGNSIRSQTETLFQAQMKAIGIKISIQNYDANTFFGSNLPNGTYQIAEFAWVATPFLSGNQSIYCSYTNTQNCGQNWTHSASSQVDTNMANGVSAPSTAQETSDFNKADSILWQNMVTLPLYQKPQFWAWSNNLKGVVPNTSSTGVTWNAENWSISS
ncbi:MAG TPA: ABC transporter family substrate-binding protein, partial [Acidimicrobiales bacterium]|nr:ABC transporter family substrate-binding protein [Acidimicrobiales bacterium]